MNIEQAITKLADRRDAKIAAANAEYAQTVAALELVRDMLSGTVTRGRKPGGKNRRPGQSAAAREWLLARTGEFTSRDVAAGLPNVDRGIVSFMVRKLVTEGKLIHVTHGNRDKPGVYRRVESTNGQTIEPVAVTA